MSIWLFVRLSVARVRLFDASAAERPQRPAAIKSVTDDVPLPWKTPPFREIYASGGGLLVEPMNASHLFLNMSNYYILNRRLWPNIHYQYKVNTTM